MLFVSCGGELDFAMADTSPERVEPRSVLDPRQGHWPMPLAAAAISFAASARMAPVFKTTLAANKAAAAGAAAGSFFFAGLHWMVSLRHQWNVNGDVLMAPKHDAARSAVFATFTCGVFPAMWGGHAVGRPIWKLHEVFTFCGPTWRRFIIAPPGLLLISATAYMGYALTMDQAKHYADLKAQAVEDSRKIAPAPAVYKHTAL